MSWINITVYLPGDDRIIQIWNDPNRSAGDYQPSGNVIGRYGKQKGKWHAESGHELTHVTHWAEMLEKPEGLT